MVGRRSPQNPSISRLTLQPETIPSCYRRVRHTQFQPHYGRHPDAGKIGQKIDHPLTGGPGSSEAADWVPSTQTEGRHCAEPYGCRHSPTVPSRVLFSPWQAFGTPRLSRSCCHIYPWTSRAIERVERILSYPILGGLHHHAGYTITMSRSDLRQAQAMIGYAFGVYFAAGLCRPHVDGWAVP